MYCMTFPAIANISIYVNGRLPHNALVAAMTESTDIRSVNTANGRNNDVKALTDCMKPPTDINPHDPIRPFGMTMIQ